MRSNSNQNICIHNERSGSKIATANVHHNVYVYCGRHKVINTSLVLPWCRSYHSMNICLLSISYCLYDHTNDSCASTHTENVFFPSLQSSQPSVGKLMIPAPLNMAANGTIQFTATYLTMSYRILIENARIEMSGKKETITVATLTFILIVIVKLLADCLLNRTGTDIDGLSLKSCFRLVGGFRRNCWQMSYVRFYRIVHVQIRSELLSLSLGWRVTLLQSSHSHCGGNR